MHVLLIEDRLNSDAPFIASIEQLTQNGVIKKAPSLQEGIELLEQQETVFDLVVCDYHGTSNLLLSALLTLTKSLPCVVCVDTEESLKALAQQFTQNVQTKVITRAQIQTDFSKTIEAFVKDGVLGDLNTADAEFVRVKPEILIQTSPIQCDIYLRLTDNKYCKLFRKGDTFETGDLERYRDKKKIEFSFF